MGNGFFADHLVEPKSTFRTAFACGKHGPVPAALVITKRLPLFDAFANVNDDDDDAPLRAEAKSWDWCRKAGTQFAFQDVNFGEKEGASTVKKCRMAVGDLQPDPKLRALLLSRKPVVFLEVVAALAPRDVAK